MVYALPLWYIFIKKERKPVDGHFFRIHLENLLSTIYVERPDAPRESLGVTSRKVYASGPEPYLKITSPGKTHNHTHTALSIRQEHCCFQFSPEGDAGGPFSSHAPIPEEVP